MAVRNTSTGVGVELCGNAVAVNETRVVTAFHNIYDEFPDDYDQSADSADNFSFRKAFNMESKEPNVIRIFENAIISQMVVKNGGRDRDREEFISPILLRFIEVYYIDDWAVLEVVSTDHSHCAIIVSKIPSDFKFLRICPDSSLPETGFDSLKGYDFNIAGYKASEDDEETLSCQVVDYSRVKPISRVIRMQGALNSGSCGSPWSTSCYSFGVP